MCIPLENINSSIKSVSKNSVAESIRQKSVPVNIVGYSHDIHVSTLETNSLVINSKGTNKQNTDKMCFGKVFNL